MNEIQIFTNELFGSVRILEQNDGKVLFCGADVAKALGYSDTPKAIKAHCKADGWVICPVIDSMGRTQDAKFITEGNLYRLITHSKLPDAEKFERWVFDEILPTVHKYGAYMTEQTLEKALTSPDFLIQLATQLKTEQEQRRKLEITVAVQEQQIAELKSKATYCDEILSCKNAIPITLIAKDYGMSAQKMNKLLKELEIQFKCGGSWMLKQCYADKGYVKSMTYTYETKHGKAANVQTCWTQEGRLFIYKKLKENGVLPLMEQ